MSIKTDQFDTINATRAANIFVANCHAHRRERVKYLKQLFQANDKARIRQLRNSFFRDPKIKISALSRAGIKMPCKADWLREARCFDPLAPTHETTEWWFEQKRRGGQRVLCNLPPFLKASHYLIADVVTAQLGEDSPVYNLKGRGRDKLVEALNDKLANGFGHYRVYDIRDCFPNVSPNAIYGLNLPRRIIDHALNLNNLDFRQRPEHGVQPFTGASFGNSLIRDIVDNGPSGIMQGSPASNVILAYLLQTLPQPAQEAGHEFLFGDDLILVAKDEETCCRVEEKLMAFFSQTDLGPLTLIKKFSGHHGAFEYLGYEFRYDTITGLWDISLSHDNWNKAMRLRCQTLMRLYRQYPHGIFPQDSMEEVRRMLSGFTALSDKTGILEMLAKLGPDEVEIAQMRQPHAS